MRRAKGEPKLDEVKFVLRKLQRFDASEEESAGEASPPGALIKVGACTLGRTPLAKEYKANLGRHTGLYLLGAGAITFFAVLYFAAGIGTIPENPKIAASKSTL